ncbi:transporter [Leifsonia xyli subsp. xyli]|uniref:ABC transporter, permease protein n=2 Tax=Leifsonia xyli subsp. xyli TaxID=59736 RepID=Q6AG84_LEIXX|nr:carbohydrate ABC transporter permease [Leifsonia xyli]AAT88611.1 ABC transporter, permease protein [Leifsonia xyli subsp. xyli str. CTCB07]ODA90558.1 transporter [Leifsonia xyli subsp. xyli]
MSRILVQRRTFGTLRWVVIAVLVVATVFPFYYMAELSLVPIEQVLLHPDRLWVPLQNLTLRTYADVMTSQDDGGQGFGGFMLNSALVALATVAVMLLVSIPGSYAVSRLNFFGRRQISALFLAVYLFPVIIAIPLFVGFSALGIRESLFGLVIVYIAQTIPMSIHMLRSYLRSIPASVEEEAMVDGDGRGRILWQITVPLAMPSIVSTGLYVFMIAWNEFLFALLFLAADRDLWTVSLGLSQLSNGIEVSKTVLMAGSVLLTIPIIVLYGLAERSLTEGLTSGADKG